MEVLGTKVVVMVILAVVSFALGIKFIQFYFLVLV